MNMFFSGLSSAAGERNVAVRSLLSTRAYLLSATPVWTWILRGRAEAALGSFNSRTPSVNVASTPSASTSWGKCSVRENSPTSRSLAVERASFGDTGRAPAADRELVTGDRNVDVFALRARQLSLGEKMLPLFPDIHRRKRAAGGGAGRTAARRRNRPSADRPRGANSETDSDHWYANEP